MITKREFLKTVGVVPTMLMPTAFAESSGNGIKEKIGGVSILNRKHWGAASPKWDDMKKRWRSEEKIKYITIHHTATSIEGKDPLKTIKGNQEYHVSKGWGDVAYHYMVTPDGKAYEARSPKYASDSGSAYLTKSQWSGSKQNEIGESQFPKSELNSKGISAPGASESHLNVSFVGKFYEKGETYFGEFGVDSEPTEAAFRTVEKLVAGLLKKYNLTINDVYFHREVGLTACPGNIIYRHFRGDSMNRLSTKGTGFIRIKNLL